jgi:DNA replication protein DnaC
MTVARQPADRELGDPRGGESTNSDLAFYLKRLKLPRVAEQLPKISQLAAQEDWSYQAFLTSLLEVEVFARDQAALERRIRAARFPSRSKTLENFDFNFQTSVRRQVMLQLASLRFIELAQNVIFLGPPGTGKTHLSLALGLKACFAGYRVLFLSAVEMVAQLLEAKKRGALKQAFTRLAKPDLLIIDEVGYIPFAQEAANLFFQVISRRYETASLILTSNRAFSAWGQVFGGDVVVAAAMIDRLVHHAEIVSLKGSSFRLKGKPEFTKEGADSALSVEPVASA